MIAIKSFPRIHVTLLDMSANGYRQNGGIGFYINSPSLLVKIEKSKHNCIIDKRELPYNFSFNVELLLSWLDQLIDSLNIQQSFNISIFGDIPSHFGFGASTSIRMSCIEGINILLDLNLSQDEIIKYSNRGGTSGVGVHGYFSGGLILDLGHDFSENGKLLPSRSKEKYKNLPLLLRNIKLPNWDVGILIPKNIAPKSHNEEKIFFNSTCPIPAASVYETTYHSIFGVCASVMSKSKKSFYKSINNIQNQTWKKAERNLYPSLKPFEQQLFNSKAEAIGMSSLGPLLYFFSENLEHTINDIKKSPLGSQCDVFITSFNNKGREVICLS